MKRTIALLLSILMLSLPFAYASAQVPAEAHQSLINSAEKLTAHMLEVFADENYAQIFTSASQLTDEINEALAFDYTQPTRYVVLTLPSDGADLLWRAFYGAEPSNALREELMHKLTFSLPSLINGRLGTAWLAASSVLTVSDTALLTDVPQGGYIVLSAFGEAAPMLCVSAWVKADGLTEMNATLVKVDSAQMAWLLDESLIDLTALADGDAAIQAFFSGISHDVYEVKTN